MVTETTKCAIWDVLLDASRAARYYAVISDRHLHRKRIRVWLQAIAGGIAAVSFIWPPDLMIPAEIFVSIGGLLVILVVVLEKMWTNHADLLASVQSDLSRISAKYSRLFYQSNNDQIEESVARYAHENLLELLEKTCDRVDIPIDQELAVKTQQEAFDTETERYTYVPA